MNGNCEYQGVGEAPKKDGFAHFMLKEIYEQPQAFQKALQGRIQQGQVKFAELNLTREQVKRWDKIYIIACGTAYHSGLFGKLLLEEFLGVAVEVEIASEFRYRHPLLNENTLAIFVSQSGETADTLGALRKAKNSGATTLAITNVVGSTIAQEADYNLYLGAGPEIAVASTKAYTSMLIMQYLLSIYLAQVKGTMPEQKKAKILTALQELPEKAQQILTQREFYPEVIQKIKNVQSLFFIGRVFDYYIALEGALKLKETSYIHAEAYGAGEIKHGTMAIVTEETPVVAVAVQKSVYEKTVHIVKEVVAKGAFVSAVVEEGDTEMQKWAHHVIYIPQIENIVSPILAVIPLQLLAYYTAVARGCNVDQPRNLTKAVTME
ncbi:MAG TPA: glutamine--fructose-6-phosphate transaminase (isomerizing) [Clostridia bacterium]|jgi:glucosamine--fructose-6-phosphate aminotransferase (isomerizing)|nr:glutamine--fructose-6-phosphate transaminase (isomerizing) [Clostridia bacterium]HHY05654.1 glutamine--fructose-6-phosphate transaminase (isomerizing) [Clostridia bacterium]